MIAVATQEAVGFVDDRSRVLSAVITRIEPMDFRFGGYLSVAEYAGELSATRLRDEAYQELLGRAPAVLATIGDGVYTGKSIRRLEFLGTHEIEIFVVSNHLGSKSRRQSGQGAQGDDPGAWHILQDVRNRLMGWQLAVENAGVISINGESRVIADQNLTVWRATYEVGVLAKQLRPQERATHPALSIDSDVNLVDGDPANPVVETESTHD